MSHTSHYTVTVDPTTNAVDVTDKHGRLLFAGVCVCDWQLNNQDLHTPLDTIVETVRTSGRVLTEYLLDNGFVITTPLAVDATLKPHWKYVAVCLTFDDVFDMWVSH